MDIFTLLPGVMTTIASFEMRVGEEYIIRIELIHTPANQMIQYGDDMVLTGCSATAVEDAVNSRLAQLQEETINLKEEKYQLDSSATYLGRNISPSNRL